MFCRVAMFWVRATLKVTFQESSLPFLSYLVDDQQRSMTLCFPSERLFLHTVPSSEEIKHVPFLNRDWEGMLPGPMAI